jgi:PQQ-dependent catabolism-associated CXXCW motif protein
MGNIRGSHSSRVKTRHAGNGRFTVLLLLSLCLSSLSAIGEQKSDLFSDAGYRVAEFRAPVPEAVPEGNTVSTRQLQNLIQEQSVVLIDVLPTPIKPKDRPDHLLWLAPARNNILGSYWLPNVGFGALSTELDNYFKDNLERLTNGDKTSNIVLYCLADCWMSWNAAKRAAQEYGYANVYWYPDGTTGWEAEELPVEPSIPVPMENATY